ncbi:MAG: hypothetical protein U0V48_17510 [Anaerolineales bacterium]
MANKKSQPKAQENSVVGTARSSGMTAPASPWKWVYILGVLVAGVTSAIGFTNPIFSWVMLIVGLLVGFLYFDSDDVTNFGLRYLIVVGVAAYPSLYLSGTGMPGMYVSGFLNGFVNFLGPVLLAQIIAAFWKKYFQ